MMRAIIGALGVGLVVSVALAIGEARHAGTAAARAAAEDFASAQSAARERATVEPLHATAGPPPFGLVPAAPAAVVDVVTVDDVEDHCPYEPEGDRDWDSCPEPPPNFVY